VTQVGYHNRFVGPFAEVKRLIDAGAIGSVTHTLGEAYGPVVLRPKGSTWRSRKEEGGGALYDYAAHPLNLLNWYFGAVTGVGGTELKPIFSREIDDEVHSTLFFAGGRSAHLTVNWSDESQRKMTTRITVWGTAGRIFADRQEIQVYLRDGDLAPEGYERGWNVRYGTELTAPVGFYLRGEEYSAQIEHFADCIRDGRLDGLNGFESAAETDRVIALMVEDAGRAAWTRPGGGLPVAAAPSKRRRRFRIPWVVPRPAGQLDMREGS
jgi:predicted dehydrogenase